MYGAGKDDPMDAAFKEYNCFGLAEHNDQYKMLDKDCQAMKARLTGRSLIHVPFKRSNPEIICQVDLASFSTMEEYGSLPNS